jgi:cell division protein FtsW
MARTLKSDKWLFVATLLLVATGVVMVYSASAMYAVNHDKPPYYFLFKQGAWALLGLVVLGIVMRVDYRVYKQPVVIWSTLGAVAVALVLVLFGHKINGTKRWFSLPGITLQPSELAKLASILFTAALLERRMHRINDLRYTLVPIGIVTFGLVGLILLEPDFGTAFALLVVVMAMVFTAGLSWRYLMTAALLMLPAIGAVAVAAPYRMRRLLAFLNPAFEPSGANFHTRQAIMAIGSGGVFGRGLMDSVQKLGGFLPEPHTDSIFAIIGEELGLIGATCVLLLFCVVAWRGLRAAVLAPDRFGSLLAIGFTAMMTVQAFINVSVVVGMLPNKGMPLPFVSNGGSSLLINLVAMGILLNITQQASSVAARRTGDLTMGAATAEA